MPRKEDNVPATLRAMAVLEALVAAERPPSLADLTLTLRLPKPTLYRMLGMLEGAGLVAREPGARRYAPGPRLAALGRAALLNGGLRAERHAILARLVDAIGETCNFTMLDGDAVVYLDRVEAAWPSASKMSFCFCASARVSIFRRSTSACLRTVATSSRSRRWISASWTAIWPVFCTCSILTCSAITCCCMMFV